MSGGPSAEREVSLRSGEAVSRALQARGYAVVTLDPVDERWVLPEGTEVVFLALHGNYGEDGTIQRRLDGLGVAYTGCDAAASAVAFDKLETKRRLVAAGLPTPRHVVVGRGDGWPEQLTGPLVMKPVSQGSSVGLAFLTQPEEWTPALEGALRHDSRVLVEERIMGRELTVGILGEQALPVVEIKPGSGTYDYHDKYTPGATEYRCPAELPPETVTQVQRVAREAFQVIAGRDYSRVDVLLGVDASPWVLEVNTLPGMTETSLFPKSAAAAGLDFEGLCERMLEMACRRAKRG